MTALILTAVSLGVLHTLLGPDHYLPFIAMARIRGWSHAKTACITFLCAIGHVLSSIVLGFLGIGFGLAVTQLQDVEAKRGELAGWAPIAFGMVYGAWGLRRAFKKVAHAHGHVVPHPHNHGEGIRHTHAHGEASRPAKPKGAARELTPWVLFTIFVFGPCEPLIPILIYPAAQHDMWGVAIVAGVFGCVTIATMLTVVMLVSYGVRLLPVERLGRFTHAIAGAIVLLCGVAVKLGL
jgi:sulfite exporter TauE/SafE